MKLMEMLNKFITENQVLNSIRKKVIAQINIIKAMDTKIITIRFHLIRVAINRASTNTRKSIQGILRP